MIGYDLPTTIEIKGKEYPITEKGHFKVILDCFELLNDDEIPENLRAFDCLKIFFEDINSDEDIANKLGVDGYQEAVQKMFQFYNCNQLEVPQKSQPPSLNLVDWETDAQLICAAILEVAGVDIRSLPFLHWFTFMGYYMSINPNSAWGNIINIRYKKARGKKLEKHEREYIMNNPQYFTTREHLRQQKEDEEWLASVWGKE